MSFLRSNPDQYAAAHQWAYRTITRNGECDECGKVCPTHFHNLSGEYKRELDDWRELCYRHHAAEHRHASNQFYAEDAPVWGDSWKWDADKKVGSNTVKSTLV